MIFMQDMSEEDRLMLDRSPDELASNDNDDDLGDSDSDDDLMAETTDGERIIYPWMKKIHVAGVGKCKHSLYDKYSLTHTLSTDSAPFWYAN